jgi:hypothetical protein
MYGVVSKWQFDPAREQDVLARADRMMHTINGWPGVVSAVNIRIALDALLAVIFYADEATYQSLIHDPNGPFSQAVAQHGIEEVANWVWSERGLVMGSLTSSAGA